MNTLFTAPRIVISGLSGGGGKTLVSLGLTRLLARRGLRPAPCKKGPDYIDAGWLALAAGRPAVNLDPFFLDEERLRSLFQYAFDTSDLAIIEGNRGLYDGRDVQGSCSTAALARTLEAPVILTLTVTKMTRTAAAIVAGLAHFEKISLAGVILNQVASARHANLIRECIEQSTGIPVLGVIPRLKEPPIPERHMGLTSIHCESPDTFDPQAALDQMADLIEQHVDVEALLAIARSAPPLPIAPPFWPASSPDTYQDTPQTPQQTTPRDIPSDSLPAASQEPASQQPAQAELSAPALLLSKRPPVIGYIRDAALWFYYEENLEALRRAGSELRELSLLDASPWPHIDGLYLGGGFPEMVAARLTASPHMQSLRDLSLDNRPIYAECGGFMVLCTSLVCNGMEFPMSGLFPARAECFSSPQGLGYVEATVTAPNPFHPVGSLLRGHEFHYSRCTALGPLHPTLTLSPGVGMSGTGHRARGLAPQASDLHGRDGLLIRRTFAAYTHLFAPSVPHWAPLFVAACRKES